MHRLSRLLALGLMTTVLVGGSALSAAAQGLAACPFASDAVIAQALGPGAHGQVVPNGSNSLCAVTGVTDQPLVLTHVTNAFPNGAPAADQLAQSGPFSVQGPGGSGQFTPIQGLGDVATFLMGSGSDGKSGAMLTVVSGTDLYTFAMSNPPDNAQDLLTGLAQAILANAQQQQQ